MALANTHSDSRLFFDKIARHLFIRPPKELNEMNDKPIAVILAAGLGSRLGRPHPKCLTKLSSGETILARQLRLLGQSGLKTIVVVGFKLESILEAHPNTLFVYNPNFDTTNTSKSLLCALRQIGDGDVMWLNGDVVFDEEVLERLLKRKDSCVAVNNAKVGQEEVKYTVSDSGYINAISKQISNALGESLGINVIRAEHLELFRQCLADVGEQDYFEKGMEQLIEKQNNIFTPVDVSDLACIEIDFVEDLQAANAMIDHN